MSRGKYTRRSINKAARTLSSSHKADELRTLAKQRGLTTRGVKLVVARRIVVAERAASSAQA